ncbi:hypothetical protein KM043_007663 [Ampulex compressa]|nr:hypothetical protein KM043_007663 [Ampulex compressa]
MSSLARARERKCAQCDKNFLKQKDLACHAKYGCPKRKGIRHPKSAFIYHSALDCPQCGKTFKRRKDLNYHVRHLCGIRGIQCPYCSKCYTYTSNVKYHINRYHNGKELLKWQTSGPSIHSSEAKSCQAPYRYHPNERKRFECLSCGRCFTQKTTVTRHLRYFCGQGHRYQCPYCEMKASCSSNIYRHVRSRHAGQRAHAIKLFSPLDPRRTA